MRKDREAVAREMKTILIVDPESAGQSLGEAMNRHGFTTYVVSEAKDALAIVRNGLPVDLVIMELLLPDMDGLDFLNTMKLEMPALPILVATARGSIETYLQALGLGAIEYINKPVLSKELARIVSTVLERQGPYHMPPQAA